MLSMSISYEETGRTAQKARTRAALVRAARQLLREGTTPSIEETAEVASISRATAYRYFPNQEALLVEAHPEVEAPSLLGEEPPTAPEARLDLVVRRLAAIFLEAEESYRAMLRLSLEPDAGERGQLTLRQGRRYLWLEDALEPLRDRVAGPDFRRLVDAIATVIGIEALVTLTDLGGLSRDEAVEVMRWSARSLLRAALEESRSEG